MTSDSVTQSFVITHGKCGIMRDSGVICKNRLPGVYDGLVVLGVILWRHKRSPVSSFIL